MGTSVSPCIEDPDLPVWLAGVSTLAEVSWCTFNPSNPS